MSFFDILHTIIIMPLKLFFEVLYSFAYKATENPGLSIVVLSLCMNFLVLPLYKRADAMQEAERDIENKLRDGISHIKKTFKGDEKMMMLQTYYRQNDYRPTDVFKGSVSLFLEIPFFIAAYQFLSHLQLLHGVAFGPIADLGAADGLITIGSISVNLLPIIMTGVNLISCLIFTKGYPAKTKIQLYGMAVFFFFFLYSSPSGLVFYWTLNNLFSLVKTIFYKLKNPGKVLRRMFAIIGVLILIYGLLFYHTDHIRRLIIILAVGLGCIIPEGYALLETRLPHKKEAKIIKSNSAVFYAGAGFLSTLLGLLIPSAVISSSPQEFVDISNYVNPLWYICSAFCLSFGLFVVWIGIFYRLASEKSRPLFEMGIWIVCGVATVDYMFFGKGLGILTSNLKYLDEMEFSGREQLINIVAVILVAAVFTALFVFLKRHLSRIIVIALIALAGMSVYNMAIINSNVKPLKEQARIEAEKEISFNLSKEGKNVVVFMIDRGMNEYIPYIMNEKPELKKQFAGFTYYANVTSFGGHTNIGSPALYGGYEYTPEEMNKRDTEELSKKHNEALMLMPLIFDESGYDVTVCDQSYANYSYMTDQSIYDDYEDINTFITSGAFADEERSEAAIRSKERNFFCYSFVKVLPLCLQKPIYDKGDYNETTTVEASVNQTLSDDFMVGDACEAAFLNAYAVLKNLPLMTNITEGDDNTFMVMANDTAHEVMLLQEPDYVPELHVDNREYEAEHRDRYTVDGVTLAMNEKEHYTFYQSNMAALLQLGAWFDYLREEGVYDNTRIIIVSDHGAPVYQLEDMVMPQGERYTGDDTSIKDATEHYDTEYYYPLLMMKNFDSNEYEVNEEFMTNADVPTMAFDGLVENPVNPFTGKQVNNDEKYAHDQHVLASGIWDIMKNNGTRFEPGTWLSVHDDVRDVNNWKEIEDPLK